MAFAFVVGVLQQNTVWSPHAPRFAWFAAPRGGPALLGAARRGGGRRNKGHTQLRIVLVHQAERKLPHHLEARQARAQVLMRQAQQVHRGLHRGHGRPGRQSRGRKRIQLHRRGGDDAQRAFAADEQIAQVVTRVVLAQPGEAFPDLALRRDHFEAQAQLARVAVAHHGRAAGIGAQVAADGATALGRQTERKQKTGLLRRRLQVLQDRAGLHRHAQVGAVDGAHRVHAAQAEHDLLAAAVGHRAHRQARVAALRHDGRAVRRAGAHHGGHLGRVGGAHHGQRLAVLAAAPVAFVAAQVALGQHVGGAHGLAQRVEKGSVGGHGRSLSKTELVALVQHGWEVKKSMSSVVAPPAPHPSLSPEGRGRSALWV